MFQNIINKLKFFIKKNLGLKLKEDDVIDVLSKSFDNLSFIKKKIVDFKHINRIDYLSTKKGLKR